MRFSKHTILFLIFGYAGLARAGADDPKAVKKVDDIDRAAMEDYDLLEFEDAKKQLNEALILVKKSKLEKSSVAAKTHMDLAIVYAGGMSDQDNALLEMIAALEIDASLKLDPAYKSPDLVKVFDQAKQTVASNGKPENPPDGTNTPENPKPDSAVVGLQHTAVEDAKGGDSVPIAVKVGADVKAKQVVLYYRSKGDEDYTPVAMKNSAGVDWSAEIPNTATTKDAVHYYIEAKNASGKVLASVASAGSPNIISVTLASAHHPEDENPLGDNHNKAHRDPDGGGDDDGGSSGGISGGVHTASRHRIFLAIGIGTGGGFIGSGKTEVSGEPVTCCVAPAPLHFMPEIGYWLAPQMVISLYGRIGLPLGADVPGAATLAPAGFARFSYLFSPTGQGFFAHGDLGAGYIRDVIKLKSNAASGVAGNTDTFVSGPLFLGGGVGYTKDLSANVAFLAETNLELGIPVVKAIGGGTAPGSPPAIRPFFGVNIDLTLGLNLNF